MQAGGGTALCPVGLFAPIPPPPYLLVQLACRPENVAGPYSGPRELKPRTREMRNATVKKG